MANSFLSSPPPFGMMTRLTVMTRTSKAGEGGEVGEDGGTNKQTNKER